MIIIQLAAFFGFFGFVILLSGVSIVQLVNIPSILALLIISIPTLIASGHFKHVRQAFSIVKNKDKKYTLETLKNAGDALKMLMIIPVICSFCITVIGCVGIIHNLGDATTSAKNLMVSFLPLFYASILILIILPFYSRIMILQNKAFGLEY